MGPGLWDCRGATTASSVPCCHVQKTVVAQRRIVKISTLIFLCEATCRTALRRIRCQEPYESETAWNEGPPFGDFQAAFDSTDATGGGFSVLFDQPPWQKATIKDGKQRAVPDVTYNAGILHGVLTYLAIPGITPG